MENEGLYIIIAFILGFLIAQIYKLISGLIRNYRTKEVTNFRTAIRYFMRSGGMPSGHALSFTSATAYIGMLYGWLSPMFALSVCMLSLVLYDACHVRFAVGELGVQMNKILEKTSKPALRVMEGHTISQVVVGVILGAILGIIVYFAVH